jgi:prevent-host-death family protein
MVTVTTIEAKNNIDKLWEKAASEPVTVEYAGKPMVVIMSVQEYSKLKSPSRKQRVAGTGASLLANLDVKAFLAIPIDEDFAEYM